MYFGLTRNQRDEPWTERVADEREEAKSKNVCNFRRFIDSRVALHSYGTIRTIESLWAHVPGLPGDVHGVERLLQVVVGGLVVQQTRVEVKGPSPGVGRGQLVVTSVVDLGHATGKVVFVVQLSEEPRRLFSAAPVPQDSAPVPIVASAEAEGGRGRGRGGGRGRGFFADAHDVAFFSGLVFKKVIGFEGRVVNEELSFSGRG